MGDWEHQTAFLLYSCDLEGTSFGSDTFNLSDLCRLLGAGWEIRHLSRVSKRHLSRFM